MNSNGHVASRDIQAEGPGVTGRPRRKSIVVLVGTAPGGDRPARAVAESLNQFGFDTVYLGRENNLGRIAAAVLAERADAVELCVDRQSGVRPLRNLLDALSVVGRSDARIVLHRVV